MSRFEGLKGSHHFPRHPYGQTTVIPAHSGETLGPGLLSKILREESGADVSPFERIADLTFFAVQSRYDDSMKIISPDWPLL